MHDSIKLTIMLTQSGKWPTELEAVNAVKSTFLKKIVGNLRKKGLHASLISCNEATVYLVRKFNLFNIFQ